MTENTMTRRDMLKVSGLIALGLGGALSMGLGARAGRAGAFTAGEGSPYDAWTTLPRDGSPQALIAAAVLAANPHNTQPWRFTADTDTITVHADHARALPATDPTDAELVTGLGCAIENLAVAAAAAGQATTVEATGTGDTVARITLRPGAAAEGADLFPAIPRRHTNRGPYRADRALPEGSLAAGAARLGSLPLVELTWLQSADRDRFGDLTVRATEAVIADRGQSGEINQWWRATRAEIEAHRDGMTLDAQGLPAVTTFLAKVLPPTTQQQNDASWLANTRNTHVASAAAYGLLSVTDAGSAAAQIQVGRAFQRLHLWATTQGLALHPLNQVTERIARDRSLGNACPFQAPLSDLTPPGRVTLFAFRIGVPTVEARPSPRRPLADVIAA
ncbi:MAG: hypothetical protein WCF04_00770 [Candidatus Nanopelagicales bacterium]